ncbi:tetratricopeptide repeat protein, partial [Streptomyces sp. NPDC091204]|uniref:tetratricopeptide repeat protein n=1 Tax=Streptomyces sp. NPDC091204 TaxID=3155299 RepID=UPI00341A886B
ALTTITEAVTIRRRLVRDNPAAYLPDLASSLTNLANLQAQNGDRPGALTTITEAVTIRRRLVRDNPAAYLPDLASSLNNLATFQGDNGDRQSALTTIAEAVTIRRRLVRDNPAAHLPDLASSLNNLATLQGDNGDRPGALTTITEATNLYRTLTQENPAAHLPDLAMVLNNLAALQAQTGDRPGALTTITEATNLYRTLNQENAAAHLPDLAGTLNNLAALQAQTGDRPGALTTFTEATHLYRTLTQENPAAHLPGLIRTLNNLRRTTTVEDALAAFAEAERALVAHPEAVRYLVVQRAALEITQPQSDSGLCTLIALADGPASAGQPDLAAFRARHLLRAHSQADAAKASQVSALWRDATGAEPPPWLALPEASVKTAVDWMNSPTWADSRTFWDEHADVLASAETAAALEELALAFPGAEEHLKIAREAAASPDSAFRPYVTAELLDAWIGLPTWEESQAYLTDHAAALLHDQALELLGTDFGTADSSVHHALITLARADGIPAAYRYAEDRPALNTRLQQLLNAPEADPGLLRGIALLELFAHQEQFIGAAHLALAGVLAGEPATPTVWSCAEPGDRDRVISEIAALIRRHPAHAAALSTLIQSLVAV